MQTMELMHVSRALFDEMASGQNVTRALTMEGGRIAEIFNSGAGGIRGTTAALVEMAVPFAPLLAVVIAATGAFLVFKSAYDEVKEIAEGSAKSGVSSDLFQA